MVTEQPYPAHRDGHDDDRSGAGGVCRDGEGEAHADSGREQSAVPTDWERLGRARPVPFALFDDETGQRLTGRAERAEWNAACDGGRPPSPVPVEPHVVPGLPEEMLKAMGWREVIPP